MGNPQPIVIPRPLGTRAEHLAWCKVRALQLLPDDPEEARTSMFSDLRGHPEWEDHPAIMLGAMLMVTGRLQSEADVRKWIEDFR